MKLLENYENTGQFPAYDLLGEIELLEKLPDSKPSKRIIKTKKGLKAIKALTDIEQNHNHNLYTELLNRVSSDFDALALFYRGTKISFRELFYKVDSVASSMISYGIKPGDEIAVCMTNTPELVYTLLAANKIGVKVNCFGANFNKDYINKILDGVSKKILFISDDLYESVKDNIDNKFKDVIMCSLADSLPSEPSKTDEYEPSLEKYYHFNDKVGEYQSQNGNITSYKDFLKYGESRYYIDEVYGDLDTDYLITYTSGSTVLGVPKAICHKNRSAIVSGIFHDPELCGNPKIPHLRGLAHIHADSNTNLITCIFDNLLQGWSVALEPEYDEKKALDYIILNKPNYLNITTSQLLEVSKEYLIDKRYHENGKGRKLPFLLAAFAVGEATSPGEEKFINKFLRESKAGSGVKIKGLSLPFTTLSIGGGDCEHGGIYYTLWKSLYQTGFGPFMEKHSYGMTPVPYAHVTCLKQNESGEYIECDYNETGLIVANSYSSMSAYKDNADATKKMIVTDSIGRDWLSCNVYGYIDELGGVHAFGRYNDGIYNGGKIVFHCCELDEVILKDSKNILSSSTCVDDDNNLVATIQFQYNPTISKTRILTSVYERCANVFPKELLEKVYVRVIPFRESYPLTGSQKRSFMDLKNMGLDDTINLDFYKVQKEEKNKKGPVLAKKK